MNDARSRFGSPVLWLLLAVFALEFFLFDQFGARRHTPVYPRWNDQIQYLTESYAGYEYARAHGLAAGLWQALINPSLQGTLHDFWAVIAFRLAGPSRAAALALNMLALIAWQAALFAGVLRRTSQPALAFAAAILPLTLRGPWENIPGSAFDFRLDHFAMCALGITAAMAWRSDDFRSRRGAIFFGLAVGLTLLTRFLTGAYFALIFAGLSGWALSAPDRKRRLANLGLAALIAFVMAAPILWLNRAAVRDYYWIGHYVGPESAIRNSNLGVSDSLAFVATHLGQRHVGLFCGAIVVVVGVILAGWRGNGETRPRIAAPWVIGALFLLGPALILTLHPQKSEVVVGALVPGAVMLVIALWLVAARRASSEAMRFVAIGLTLAALAYFVRTQVRPVYSPSVQADLRLVNAIADQIVSRARAGGMRAPRVAVDHITDSLDAQVLRVLGYERHHVWLDFDMTLPTGIAEPADAEIMARMSRSDFVFLTADDSTGPYPYDRKLAVLRPQLRAWCDEHLRVANQFSLFGRRMVLYQRPEIPFP